MAGRRRRSPPPAERPDRAGGEAGRGAAVAGPRPPARAGRAAPEAPARRERRRRARRVSCTRSPTGEVQARPLRRAQAVNGRQGGPPKGKSGSRAEAPRPARRPPARDQRSSGSAAPSAASGLRPEGGPEARLVGAEQHQRAAARRRAVVRRRGGRRRAPPAPCGRRAARGDRPRGVTPPRIRVPAPCAVKSSSSTACGARPSRITTARTPPSMASSAVWVFGIMPPEITPGGGQLAHVVGAELRSGPRRRRP